MKGLNTIERDLLHRFSMPAQERPGFFTNAAGRDVADSLVSRGLATYFYNKELIPGEIVCVYEITSIGKLLLNLIRVLEK